MRQSFFQRVTRSVRENMFANKVRQRLSNSIDHALLGPVGGFLPSGSGIEPSLAEGILPSILEVILPGTQERILPDLIDFRILDRATIVKTSLPGGLPAGFRQDWAIDEKRLYRFRNAIIGIPSGACISNNHLLMESFGGFIKTFSWGFPSELVGRTAPTVLGSSGLCTPVESTGYSHFLLEEIPRLLDVTSIFPDAEVVVWEGAPRYIREVLELIRQDAHGKLRIHFVRKGKWKVQEVIFSAANMNPYTLVPRHLDLLRERAWGWAACDGGETRSIIFVARRDMNRAVSNQNELAESLRKIGVQVFYLEEMSWIEQIRAFASAEIVIGQHGAGLSNLVFSRDGVRLVEIFEKYRRDMFARLCALRKGAYQFVEADPSDRGWVVDPAKVIHAIAPAS